MQVHSQKFCFSGDVVSQGGASNIHVVVTGFVTNMSDWMGAADLIITKAGPGTIAEACCKGLPILLNCYLPGQEEGNVRFVTEGGFGGYSSMTSRIVGAARNLLTNERRRAVASERAKAAMDPAASLHIAKEMVQLMMAKTGHCNRE